MRIIKVDAIDSTNSFVRKFYEGKSDFEPVCVRAISQTKGRGQRGAEWLSKPGENLTFSILYPQNKLYASHHFLLNSSISLAVLEVLQTQGIPNLKVKWPNDILSAKNKIGGILIENILKGEEIAASIIGVGLNVNQEIFEGMAQASSLKSITGKDYDLEELLVRLTIAIENRLDRLKTISSAEVLGEYIQQMFCLNKICVFSTPDGQKFNGIIRGVTNQGKLNLEIDDGNFKTFDLKEVKLHY